MSTHRINVVRINELRPHGNADNLELTTIEGWQCAVRKGDFKVGDLAVYIEPDYVVDVTRAEFMFLDKDNGKPARIRAKRLRGEVSYGLLIPCDSFHAEGDDVMDYYGITRYEPPVSVGRGGNAVSKEHWPVVYQSKFDLENLQRVADMFRDDEVVVVTEKIHGANARYVWQDDTLHIGSRSQWLQSGDNSWWHRAATKEIADMCRGMPGVVFYGEVFGDVQSLKYGCRMGEVKFALFAALSPTGMWVEQEPLIKLAAAYGVAFAPVLYTGAFDMGRIKALAEEDSAVPGAPKGHMREGVVIVPRFERHDHRYGRVAAKFVSTRYWESGK